MTDDCGNSSQIEPHGAWEDAYPCIVCSCPVLFTRHDDRHVYELTHWTDAHVDLVVPHGRYEEVTDLFLSRWYPNRSRTESAFELCCRVLHRQAGEDLYGKPTAATTTTDQP